MPAKRKSIIPPPQPVATLPLPASPPPSAMSEEPHENPAAPGYRKEIREVTKRVMGSRQSQRKPERSNSRRQPKRGHGSQRKTPKA